MHDSSGHNACMTALVMAQTDHSKGASALAQKVSGTTLKAPCPLQQRSDAREHRCMKVHAAVTSHALLPSIAVGSSWSFAIRCRFRSENKCGQFRFNAPC